MQSIENRRNGSWQLRVTCLMKAAFVQRDPVLEGDEKEHRPVTYRNSRNSQYSQKKQPEPIMLRSRNESGGRANKKYPRRICAPFPALEVTCKSLREGSTINVFPVLPGGAFATTAPRHHRAHACVLGHNLSSRR